MTVPSKVPPAGRIRPLRRPQLTWSGLFGQGSAAAPAGAELGWRVVLPEWLILLLVMVAFCAGFLDLGSARELPGNEAGVFQSLDWVLRRSLDAGSLPLWNPAIRTGQPFLADPSSHALNPLASLPVLLLGVRDGLKVALFLSFLAAAFGTWWLARVLGLGRPARLWMALMFACSGPAVARFIQGQYGFVLGFAWLPWVLASLIAVSATRRKLHAVVAVLSLALATVAGHVNMPSYAALTLVLFTLVMAVDVAPRRPVLRVDWALVGLLAFVGLLAAGLAAVFLLPLAGLTRHLILSASPSPAGAQTLQQIWISLTATVRGAAGGIASIAPEEAYAYVGYGPFLALLLLPLAWWKGNRRLVLFLGLLLGLAVLWIRFGALPPAGRLASLAILGLGSYPTRVFIMVVIALVTLAGMALDAGWKGAAGWLRRREPEPPPAQGRPRRVAAALGLAALAAFMAWSVLEVYRTNKPLARTREPYPAAEELMGWLRRTDPAAVTVSAPNGWHEATIRHGFRYLDAWYGFTLRPHVADAIGHRAVEVRPDYRVQPSAEPAPGEEAVPVRQTTEHVVYRLPGSLPFAFVVADGVLQAEDAGPLHRDEVAPATAYLADPNRIELIAEGGPGSMLVALAASYPGWQAYLDGRRAVLRSVGGFLATPLPPGVHKVVFAFEPRSVQLGLLVSLLTLVLLVALVATELEAPLRAAVARGRAAWQGTDTTTAGAPVPEAGGAASVAPARWRARVAAIWRPEWLAFGLGLLLYGVTRLVALDRFPIFFFTDEAIQPLMAQDLLARGLRDSAGTLLPIYVEADGNRWTPLLSVYLHALTVALFGPSIFVTRATSALISLLGVVAVGLILKWIFGVRSWWAGVLVLALIPAWFLHTRTAFEVVAMTSFYACFLLFYLLYRVRSPAYLFTAVLFGAATFYSYSNGQLVIAVLALLLFLSDLPYHLRHWRTVLPALALAAVLAWPLVSFRLTHPAALGEHLHFIDSYWYRDLSLGRKLYEYGVRYATGLDPRYWFWPNGRDLVRHRVDDYGHISILMLPFFLIGLAICLRRIRSSPHRAVLLAALATPVGAALVDVAITRVLAFVVPASLLITLGLDAVLERLAPTVPRRVVAGVTFAVLALANLALFRSALVDGPYWFNDYGLYGMQYGARQLFAEAVPVYLAEHPDTTLLVSSTWSNGTDRYLDFFLTPEQRARTAIGTIDYYLFDKRDLSPRLAFVMTPNEYQTARTSPKFGDVTVEQVLPYPDGTPGFYFVRLAYAPDADAIFGTERAARRQPVDEVVTLDGQPVAVRHSRFDMGSAADLFDGDLMRLVRGMEANPLVIELTFPEPRALSGLAADVGTMDFTITVDAFADAAAEPVHYEQTFRGLPQDPHAEVPFDQGPERVSKLRIAIQQLNAADIANIHVRELRLE